MTNRGLEARRGASIWVATLRTTLQTLEKCVRWHLPSLLKVQCFIAVKTLAAPILVPLLLLAGCDHWFDSFPDTSGTTAASGDAGGPHEPCPPGLTGESCERCLVYVDGSRGDDAASGLSWEEALATVSGALERSAEAGCEVWVAEGTYRPTTGPSASERTFQLEEGVDLYGGFAGTETSRDERDIAAHPTILSGYDASPFGPEPVDFHVYHVVTGSDDAVLDGFTIRGGVAVFPFIDGAGMYNVGVSPTVRNCTFTQNMAENLGGAMFNDEGAAPLVVNTTFIENNATYAGAVGNMGGSAPTFVNVRFIGNASFEGAGLRNEDSSATIINGLFFDNRTAYSGGGAIANLGDASLTLVNATLVGNLVYDEQRAGGIYNVDGHVTVTNSVLWGNPQDTEGHGDDTTCAASSEICNLGAGTTSVTFSLVQGGCASLPGTTCGPDILDVDPMFVGTGADDLRPTEASPVLDAGSDAALPADVADLDADGDVAEALPLDLGGAARRHGAAVDLGAYEGIAYAP